MKRTLFARLHTFALSMNNTTPSQSHSRLIRLRHPRYPESASSNEEAVTSYCNLLNGVRAINNHVKGASQGNVEKRVMVIFHMIRSAFCDSTLLTSYSSRDPTDNITEAIDYCTTTGEYGGPGSGAGTIRKSANSLLKCMQRGESQIAWRHLLTLNHLFLMGELPFTPYSALSPFPLLNDSQRDLLQRLYECNVLVVICTTNQVSFSVFIAAFDTQCCVILQRLKTYTQLIPATNTAASLDSHIQSVRPILSGGIPLIDLKSTIPIWRIEVTWHYQSRPNCSAGPIFVMHLIELLNQ